MIDTGMSVVSVYRYSRDDGTSIEQEAVIYSNVWVQAMFSAVAAISFNLGYAWGMHEIQRVVC